MATIKEGMTWFKKNFQQKVQAGIQGTPFTLDLLTALAVQESFGDAWGLIFKTRPVDEVLQLCVGDSIDRSVFPKDRAELVAAPNGAAMFDIAHDALVKLASFNHGFAGVAARPNKFCHGYGIFQFDIQFFKDENPDFFLQKKWFSFDECLKLAIKELQGVAKRLFPQQTQLDDDQLTFCAIGYNIGAGRVRLDRGFKQGFKDGDGVFYGEHISEFLKVAHTVTVP
jgi:hypothetical protein